MNMKTMALGAYQTNCYILWQQGCQDCIVVDPGYYPQQILSDVKNLGLTIAAILLTHGHFDHVGAVKDLAAETGCKVYIHEKDLTLPDWITEGPLYYTDLYGAFVEEAGIRLQVIPTPGHTPGSVCLLHEDILITGDTLFACSCGRTDFPGGSWTEMYQSLKKLAAMPGDYKVYPGHGESTTMEQERNYNTYLG